LSRLLSSSRLWPLSNRCVSRSGFILLTPHFFAHNNGLALLHVIRRVHESELEELVDAFLRNLSQHPLTEPGLDFFQLLKVSEVRRSDIGSWFNCGGLISVSKRSRQANSKKRGKEK
ncbi:hypothetical protein PFISCL1PPCAC_7031, partial [Pristionchus fissidentatus]